MLRKLPPTQLLAIQWPWVLGVSLAELALSSAIIFFAVAIFASFRAILGSIPSQAEMSTFSEFFGRVFGPPVAIGLTLLATAWQGQRVRSAPRLHGLLVGLLIAIVTLVSDIFFSPPTALDEWFTILLTVLAGWLGGWWGQNILSNREAVYQTSQAIRGASKAGMLQAIGRHLASPLVVLIALMENSGEVDLPSTWVPAPGLDIPPILHLPATPPEPATVLTDLPHPWRSTLLVALTGGERLLVASRSRGFSRTEIQNYLTIGQQIALSLENLKLIEQARETGVIQERQRLAGEIHDGLTQGFVSIVTQLEMAEARLENSPADLLPLLNQVRQTARDNLTSARQMTWALRPDLQQGVPLSIALERLAQKWSAANGVPVTFETSGDERPLHPDLQTALLRVGRETLTNIAKHARASQVSLTLTYLDTLVALDVQDNGQGFDPDLLPRAAEAGGFGLKSLREQAERLGGELSIESAPGKGTTIAISLPLA